jgi:hypothetical protein
MVNPIVDALLSDFCTRQEIDPADKSVAFENFAAFCLLKSERLEQGEFQEALTDAGEEGLDAVAVIVNGVLIADPSDVEEIAADSLTINVKYVFIQAKSSESWNGGEVLKFTRAVREFFGQADIGTSNVVEAARQVHHAVIAQAAQLEENPTLKAFYVGTGKWNDGGAAQKHLDELNDHLANLDLFSSIQCEGIDGARLQQLYRSATSAATATVEFESKVTLPKIDGVEQAFLGVLPAKELMKLLADDDGDDIRQSVFEDNIRDFQGADAPVNEKIRATIEGPHRQQFAVLNNGVTIVVRELRVTANTFKLTDYQVVNGAQTSHVVFSSKDILAVGDDVLIPTRIIQTDDEDLITAIVTATNSQTVVKVDELNARAVSERNVEKYFAATKAPRDLLYERRSKQYDNQSNIVKARVIDRYTLVRATAATFADEPHLSTGYPMQLLSRLAGAKRSEEGRPRLRFFSDEDEAVVYYASASAHYRLDLFFKTGKVEARLKPARWHILRLARALCLEEPVPSFSDRKFRDWVKPFVDKIWSDKDGPGLFVEAGEIVDKAGIELSRRSLRNTAATQELQTALKDL